MTFSFLYPTQCTVNIRKIQRKKGRSEGERLEVGLGERLREAGKGERMGIEEE